MSTRGFVGFVIDGIEKIAYNHFDSYPSGLGADVLKWLHDAAKDVSTLRERAQALRVVDDTTEPTDADIENLTAYMDSSVGERRDRPDWYQLLDRTQGDPAAMLEAGVIHDASNFPANSLFAEWGYVVDLDVNVFEVYQGFQGSPHGKGRFAGRTPSRDNGYAPVALVASWPIDALPTDEEFIKTFEGNDQ